jgi:hypothetical protein|tara:strand:+ start:1268 stop:1615 length:348 start_codon:yes stop_codon:yes gene_type:complete
MNMDLLKLDPMARKMRSHVDAFYKALENNDQNSAIDHINEVRKFAEYLSEDVSSAITKSATPSSVGVNDIYAGGVPVRKFNEMQSVHATTDRVLPGTIRTSRRGPIMSQRNNRTL